jgi:PKD repeat protein
MVQPETGGFMTRSSLLLALLLASSSVRAVDFHVDIRNPAASDSNNGSVTSPLRTFAAGVQRGLSSKSRGITTRVLIHAGTYRDGVRIYGGASTAPLSIEAAGDGPVVVSGSDIYTGWSSIGNGVYSHSWTYDWGFATNPWTQWVTIQPIGLRRELVFVDGSLMTQVLTAAELKPGCFVVEEGSNRILLMPTAGVNLTASTVEVGVRDELIYIQGGNQIALRGITFQHATGQVSGAAANAGTFTNVTNLTLENCHFLWNSYNGISFSPVTGLTVRNVSANHNGVDGFGLFKSATCLFEDFESSYNNWRGYRAGFTTWAVGNKILHLRDVTFRRFRAFGNLASGFWPDTNCVNLILDDVKICNNLRGIYLEANEGPILIQDSSISGNGSYGILCANSERVTLRRNRIYNNDGAQIVFGGNAAGRPTGGTVAFNRYWTLEDNIIMGELAMTGGGGTLWTNLLATSSFARTTYFSPYRSDIFEINGKRMDLAGWKAATGKDATSTWLNPALAPEGPIDGGNRAPVVTMTSPLAGQQANEAQPMRLAATVVDTGMVQSVDFMVDGRLLAVDNDPSDGWSYVWPHPTVGTHTVVARARDALRMRGWSSTTSFTVNPSAIAVPPALVLRWKFDEGSGQSASDASVNRIDGNIVQAAWTSGALSTPGLLFNGSSACVLASPNPQLNLSKAMSIMGWVKTDAGFNYNSTGMEKIQTYRLSAVSGSAGATWSFGFLADNGSWGGAATPPVSHGAWHHIAGTFDGSRVAIYVDGVLASSKAFSGRIVENAGNPFEVARRDSAYYYRGGMDDVRIYDGALTAQQVADTVAGREPLPNRVPVAVIAASTIAGPAPLAVAFDGSGSFDADGRIVSYSWVFGDGATASGALASHTYASGGTYSARLTVVDDKGVNISASTIITVLSNNRPPTATLSTSGAVFTAPASIGLTAAAADSDGTVSRVEFYSGTALLGSDATAPYAFTWGSVAAGTYALTAKAIDNAGAVGVSSSVTVTVNPPPTTATQSPYGGSALSLPGIIQAERYDLGGEGVAYHDVEAVNLGATFRNDGVDIKPCTDAGLGFALAWMASGEWLEYTVTVATAGTYDLSLRTATAVDGAKIRIAFAGVDKTGSLAVPNTGDWQKWTNIGASAVSLSAGTQIVRISVDAGWVDLNYLAVTSTTNLILNPGFSGSGYWTNWSNALAVQAQAHSGGWSMRVGTAAGGAYQDIPAASGATTYTLSGWGKVAQAAERGWLVVDIYDGAGQKTSYSLRYDSTTYVQKSLTFTTPASCSLMRVWVWKNLGAASYFYADDLQLVRAVAPLSTNG